MTNFRRLFLHCSCMMNDWVRSKPWLALLGVISAGLSLLSVFGLLSALGVRAVPQVGLVPFLILGKYEYSPSSFLCLSNRKFERLGGPLDEVVTVSVNKYNVIMPCPIMISWHHLIPETGCHDIGCFLEAMSPSVGHWYPCFGFLVKSPLGCRARVGSLEAYVLHVPDILLWCNTCWLLGGQCGSRAEYFSLILAENPHFVWRGHSLSCHLEHVDTDTGCRRSEKVMAAFDI